MSVNHQIQILSTQQRECVTVLLHPGIVHVCVCSRTLVCVCVCVRTSLLRSRVCVC